MTKKTFFGKIEVMERLIHFLNQLQDNNNREWFHLHKSEYLEAQQHFNEFVGQLIMAIGSFDESVSTLEVKQCIYRIYRDIRFSPDKRPYKNHFGVYLCPGGRKSGYAGYYFHIEADNGDYIGNNILSSGLYMPDKKALASVRDDIYTRGELYQHALANAVGFDLEMNGRLKKLPKGFSSDTPYAELLKLKDFSLSLVIPKEVLYGDSLLEYVVNHFRTTYDFNVLLNEAVAYSRDSEAYFPEYV